MPQVLVGIERARLQHPLAHAVGGLVCDPVERVVALLLAREVARIRLARVRLGLRLRERPGQLRVAVERGEVEAGLEVGIDPDAHVAEEPGVLLLRPVAIAVLGGVGGRDVVVDVAAHAAGRPEHLVVLPAPQFAAQTDEVGRETGVRDEVDRPAERGRAVLERVRAAEDLDVLHAEGFDRLHVEAAVGEVQGHTVLHQDDPPAVERALDAGAADRDARLVGAEARLHEHAGRVGQRVRQGRAPAGLVGSRVDDLGAAGNAPDVLLGAFDRRDRQRFLRVGANDDRLEPVRLDGGLRVAGGRRAERERSGDGTQARRRAWHGSSSRKNGSLAPRFGAARTCGELRPGGRGAARASDKRAAEA